MIKWTHNGDRMRNRIRFFIRNVFDRQLQRSDFGVSHAHLELEQIRFLEAVREQRAGASQRGGLVVSVLQHHVGCLCARHL